MQIQPVQETNQKRYVIASTLAGMTRLMSSEVRAKLLKELQMSQAHFSIYINSRMGDRRDFKSDQLRIIAKILNCSVDALFNKPAKSKVS